MDFPAAHSMDTEWFAVDDQGRIALLASCESGPVPERISVQTGWAEFIAPFLGEIVRFAVEQGVLVAGKHAAGADQRSMLVCLTGAAKDAASLEYADEMTREHVEGRCRGCCLLAELFVLYECDDYDGLVYTRMSNPERAITVTDVGSPEVLRDGRIAGTDFAVLKLFQPIQYEPCMTWGDYETMTTEDGTTVAVPEHSRHPEMRVAAPAPPKPVAPTRTPREMRPREEPKKPWWKFW